MISYYISKVLELLSPPAVKNSDIDKSVWVGSGTQIVDSSVQYGTYIGKTSQCLYAEIGKYCSIANNVIIGGAEHPTAFVSTSPVFYGGYKNPLRKSRIQLGSLVWNPYPVRTTIGNDVWIGNNVIIKAGVKIGNGAVVGAGAVVVKDVPPYEVWGGVPARYLKSRFNEDLRNRLIESKWWELPQEDLKRYSHAMNDPAKFLALLKE